MAGKILLIEDNPKDEALTLRALKGGNFSHEVVVARDGAAALDLLFGRKTEGVVTAVAVLDPQLILLDLKLPKIDGLEVLRQVRGNERTKLFPVVILTSSVEEKDLVSGYALGANSYIRKPVDFIQFADTVRQLGLYWLFLNEPAPTPRGL